MDAHGGHAVGVADVVVERHPVLALQVLGAEQAQPHDRARDNGVILGQGHRGCIQLHDLAVEGRLVRVGNPAPRRSAR